MDIPGSKLDIFKSNIRDNLPYSVADEVLSSYALGQLGKGVYHVGGKVFVVGNEDVYLHPSASIESWDVTNLQKYILRVLAGKQASPASAAGESQKNFDRSIATGINKVLEPSIDKLIKGISDVFIDQAEENGSVNVDSLLNSAVGEVIPQLILGNTLEQGDVGQIAKLGEVLMNMTVAIMNMDIISIFSQIPSAIHLNYKSNRLIRKAYQQIQDSKDTHKGKMDLARMFVENMSKENSVDEMKSLIKIAFLAGQNPTVDLAKSAFYLLNFNPVILSQLKEEIHLQGENPSYYLSPHTLLNSVLEETGRLLPPIPYLWRQSINGELVLVDLYARGMLEELYGDNPYIFNPSIRGSQSLMFGVGPRTCPGWRLGKVISGILLAKLIRNTTAPQFSPVGYIHSANYSRTTFSHPFEVTIVK